MKKWEKTLTKAAAEAFKAGATTEDCESLLLAEYAKLRRKQRDKDGVSSDELRRLYIFLYNGKGAGRNPHEVASHMEWDWDEANALLVALESVEKSGVMHGSKDNSYSLTAAGMELTLREDPAFHKSELKRMGITHVSVPIEKLRPDLV